MKSSSNLLDGSASRQPQAWFPEDLTQAGAGTGENLPPKSPPAHPANLLAAFSSLAGEDIPVVPAPMPANLIKRAGSMPSCTPGSSAPNAWLPPEIGSPRPGADRSWRSTYSGSYTHPTLDVVQQAREKAEGLIAEAEAKAKQILDAARQRADELSLEAHKEGWTAAEEETQYMLQSAKNIVQQIMTWREELFARSESAVMDLVKEMAVRMFGEGLALDSEILQQNFNHVLENARSMGNITIYMNPEDAMALGPYWREYQVSISGREVQVIPSESIRRGGCFVDGKWGSVDARIETQLKSIMDTLSQPPDQML